MSHGHDPIVDRRIRIALVGCGRIAAEALRGHRARTVSASSWLRCATPIATALDAAVGRTGARGFAL